MFGYVCYVIDDDSIHSKAFLKINICHLVVFSSIGAKKKSSSLHRTNELGSSNDRMCVADDSHQMIRLCKSNRLLNGIHSNVREDFRSSVCEEEDGISRLLQSKENTN